MVALSAEDRPEFVASFLRIGSKNRSSVPKSHAEAPVTFCLCEDRGIEEFGLRLAVCGIRRHCPSAEIVVYRSEPTRDFAGWLDERRAVLVPHRPAGASSWNCKPHALLPLLREGRSQVVWMDSDVLMTRPCDALFGGCDERELGVCEEYRGAPHQGSELRTRGWGLPLGRVFPRTLNTAVLRLTPRHIPLLERWRELLADPRYVPWQTRPLNDRPLHCWGDQDVLNALLGSTEFADLPVRILRTGREIIHCSSLTSFTVLERFRRAFGAAPHFVHGQGASPGSCSTARPGTASRGASG